MNTYQLPFYSGVTGNSFINGRSWTKEETDYLLYHKKKGATHKQLIETLGRTNHSINCKLKTFKKTAIGKNQPNIIDKYETNKLFIDLIQPNSVLDTHAGKKSYYKTLDIKNVVSNDKLHGKYNNYNLDSLKLLKMLTQNFDIVDVDPFGQVFDFIDPALKLAKKGLILTYGEFGSKPFHKKGIMGPRPATKRIFNNYGFDTINDFNIDYLITKTKEMALKYNKILTVEFAKSSKNKSIWRVYFSIK